MRLAPDKMEPHIQVLGQYLGVETLHPLYQRVFPDDDELLYITSVKKRKRERYLLWFVKWSHTLPKPSEPVLFVSTIFLYFKLEYSINISVLTYYFH
jgi:hypothetical protein